jgi:hypothetical protein
MSPLTQSQLVSRPIGTAIVVTIVVGIAGVYFFYGCLSVRIHRLAAYTFFPLTAILVSHVYLLDFAELTTALLPIYMFFVACVLLFVLPYQLNADVAYGYVARVAALVGLVGVPAVIWGEFDYGLFYLSTSVSPARDLLPPIGVPPLYSVYNNPNFLAKLLFVGVIASLGEWVSHETRIAVVLLVLNAGLLYLTESRGGMGAAVAGMMVLIAYDKTDRDTSLLGAIAGITGVGVFLLISLTVPTQIGSTVDLTGRLNIWTGTLDAVLQTGPVFGAGLFGSEFLRVTAGVTAPSPHSTYFKMLLRAGFVGLTLWSVLLWGSLMNGVYREVSPTVVGIGAGFVVLGVVEGPNVFGTNTGSLLLTLTLGYLLSEGRQYTLQFTDRGQSSVQPSTD